MAIPTNQVLDVVAVMERHYPTTVEKGEDKSFRVSPTRILKCQRGAVMESLGYTEPLTPQSDMNFEYGTMRHKVIQRAFVKDGKMLTPEGLVYPEDEEYKEEEINHNDPQLLAFMDGRIKTPHGQAVLEVKTTAEKIKSIKNPLYTHADQSQLYMHLMGIKWAYLMYEQKGSKRGENPWKFFVIEYDEKRGERLLKKGRSLLRNLEKRYLPLKSESCFSCNNPACFDKEIQKREGLKGFII